MRRWCLIGLGLVLTACAGIVPLAPQSTQAEVQAKWGAPPHVHALRDGTRWLYPTGPGGQSTYVVDFAQDGRMRTHFDALNEEHFERITRGMKRADVEREIGPAFIFNHYGTAPRVLSVYRYMAITRARCFYVEYDDLETVVSTATADEKRGRDLFLGERPC
jgi:hypothetical protein